MALTDYDANIKYEVFDRVFRPWGWEYRIAVYDDTGDIGNFFHRGSLTLTFKQKIEPAKNEIDAGVLAKLGKYKEVRDLPPLNEIVEVITEADVVNFLINRGYLNEGDSLNDLPDLDPGTKETPFWRKVVNWVLDPHFDPADPI